MAPPRGPLRYRCVISEVWFGWATQEDLQPNIDGLSFDEVLLGMVGCVAITGLARFVVRRRTRTPAA